MRIVAAGGPLDQGSACFRPRRGAAGAAADVSTFSGALAELRRVPSMSAATRSTAEWYSRRQWSCLHFLVLTPGCELFSGHAQARRTRPAAGRLGDPEFLGLRLTARSTTDVLSLDRARLVRAVGDGADTPQGRNDETEIPCRDCSLHVRGARGWGERRSCGQHDLHGRDPGSNDHRQPHCRAGLLPERRGHRQRQRRREDGRQS